MILDYLNIHKIKISLLFLVGTFANCSAQKSISIISYTLSDAQPSFYNATYTSTKGLDLRARNLQSLDNGRTWINKPTTIKNLISPPSYARRSPATSFFDDNKQLFVTFINSLDNPNVDKNIAEPKEALKDYYLRYRVSKDNGKSWLFDETVNSKDGSQLNPFARISIGKNAMYLGDIGSKAIVLNDEKILLPVQSTILPDQNSKNLNVSDLYNPAQGYSFTEILILQGIWEGSNINWKLVSRIDGDPKLTTRGLIEPTIIQLNNGAILAIMRGSNGGKSDPNFKLGSYKWMSFSKDDGLSWSVPKAWEYDDGTAFFSPSAMSVLFKHSNGKVYWVGNINETNSEASKFRYPLVIGEVDQSTMKLKKSTVIVLDTLKKNDPDKQNLDLGHVSLIEDRNSKDIIAVFPRILTKSKREWATIRLKVD